MGWFGMPNMDRKEAFDELFSQSQYKKRFEMIWEKHISDRSIAIYTLDDKCLGETILWSEDQGELMYKPISWTDSIGFIPQKMLARLIFDATPFEVECYEAYAKRHQLNLNVKTKVLKKAN